MTEKADSKTIHVMVVDDHHLIINGIQSLIEEEEDLKFCGGAGNREEALLLLKIWPIDVALVDINLPEESGIELTRLIKTNYPQVRILALSMHDHFGMIQKMISAGASGYLLKSCNLEEVVEAIRIVYEKGNYLAGNVQSILMDAIREPQKLGRLTENVHLSAREKEVLELVAREYSNEQIAEKLFISERTVESHRRNLLIKTKTKSVIGLVKYAIKHQLLNTESENETE